MKYFLLLTFTLSNLLISYGQITPITLDNSGNPNEPSICFSRIDSTKLYAAANVNRFYTVNSNSWQVSKQTATSPLGVYGDPVLHWSGSDLYFAHLSKTNGKGYGYWFDRIVVQRIDTVSPWVEQSYGVGFNDNKMQDKPWLSSDEYSVRKGNVYVTWTEFDKYDSDDPEDFSRIRFSALDYGSNLFSDAVTISDTVGDCRDGDNTLEGVTTAVDSAGNIYAVWAGHENIYLDKSTDGGLSWGKDKIIAQQVNGWDMDMPNIMRANGMPFIVSDVIRDRLYVCWADERNGNADIWLKYSEDKGVTWSAPIQLNLDRTDAHQYFPNIALDPNTGTVYVAYYDFRSSNTNSFYVITVALFDLGGKVGGRVARRVNGHWDAGIANAQITPYVIPLPGKNTFYGDYLDLDIYNDKLAVVYTAYDLNQQTEVNMTLEETLSDGIFGGIAISNTPAILKNGDSATVLLNVQHPHETKVKIWLENKGEKEKHVINTSYDGTERDWDQQLGSFEMKEKRITKIKYKIKDTEIKNTYKRTVRP